MRTYLPLISVVCASLLFGCIPGQQVPTTEPLVTRDQVIQDAVRLAGLPVPGVCIVETKVDAASAELISGEEALVRKLESIGHSPAPYNGPVWWVKLEGRFRWKAMLCREENPTQEAHTMYFTFDGRTGKSTSRSAR